MEDDEGDIADVDRGLPTPEPSIIERIMMAIIFLIVFTGLGSFVVWAVPFLKPIKDLMTSGGWFIGIALAALIGLLCFAVGSLANRITR